MSNKLWHANPNGCFRLLRTVMTIVVKNIYIDFTVHVIRIYFRTHVRYWQMDRLEQKCIHVLSTFFVFDVNEITLGPISMDILMETIMAGQTRPIQGFIN